MPLFDPRSTPPGAPAPVILASASPRRRDLLAALGLAALVEVWPADVDETPLPNEDPIAMAVRLAEAKARTVQARLGPERADALVLAADTVVVHDGASLAKPRDEDENRAFLARLSGGSHLVATGHALLRGRRIVRRAPTTTVRMRELREDEIDRYVATGEGLDKAGGYAVQARGAAFVAALEGCWSNVVGLSVPTVVEAARELGVDLV